MKFFQRFSKKNFLGIDIGTFAIKIVELSSLGGKIKLENYGQILSKALFTNSFGEFNKDNFLLSVDIICQGIKKIIEEAKMKSKEAFFSIPDFLTFFTTFSLPQMTKEEISFAVQTEARKYIPVPLSEVNWDWQIVERESINKIKRLKILLVAVPREVVNQYQLIAEKLNLELLGLEAETFSLARALSEKKKEILGLIDLGAKTTTFSLIENGFLKLSHSFDISSDDLTESIAKCLEIDYRLAEKMKIKYGIFDTKTAEGKMVKEILQPLIDSIFLEGKKFFERFVPHDKKLEKIILAGRTSTLPGLLPKAKDYFKIEVEIADPFKNIIYPKILEENLKKIGPSFAIAVGLAMRGFE